MKGSQRLTLTVLVMTIDAQWEGMYGRQGTSRHYFPHADHKGFKLQ